VSNYSLGAIVLFYLTICCANLIGFVVPGGCYS